MFSQQTDREYRIMMGTDIRIRRDPLAMRMREDQIKQSTHSKADNFVRYFHVFHSSYHYLIISTPETVHFI